MTSRALYFSISGMAHNIYYVNHLIPVIPFINNFLFPLLLYDYVDESPGDDDYLA